MTNPQESGRIAGMPLSDENIQHLLVGSSLRTSDWQAMIRKQRVEVAHAKYFFDLQQERLTKLLKEAREDSVTLAAIAEAMDLSRQRIAQLTSISKKDRERMSELDHLLAIEDLQKFKP